MVVDDQGDLQTGLADRDYVQQRLVHLIDTPVEGQAVALTLIGFEGVGGARLPLTPDLREQLVAHIADQLLALIGPADAIGRWGLRQIAVVGRFADIDAAHAFAARGLADVGALLTVGGVVLRPMTWLGMALAFPSPAVPLDLPRLLILADSVTHQVQWRRSRPGLIEILDGNEATYTVTVDPAGVVPDDPGSHVLQIYVTDEELLARLSRYVAEGLTAGEVCLCVITPDHRAALTDRLDSLDLGQEAAGDQFVTIDAAATLTVLLSEDGTIDTAAFDRVLAEPVRTLFARGQQARIFGEIPAQLWTRGNLVAAKQLEDLWNELQRELRFARFCAYPVRGGARDVPPEIRLAHSHVL